jgi:hypothetical protein
MHLRVPRRVQPSSTNACIACVLCGSWSDNAWRTIYTACSSLVSCTILCDKHHRYSCRCMTPCAAWTPTPRTATSVRQAALVMILTWCPASAAWTKPANWAILINQQSKSMTGNRIATSYVDHHAPPVHPRGAMHGE